MKSQRDEHGVREMTYEELLEEATQFALKHLNIPLKEAFARIDDEDDVIHGTRIQVELHMYRYLMGGREVMDKL